MASSYDYQYHHSYNNTDHAYSSTPYSYSYGEPQSLDYTPSQLFVHSEPEMMHYNQFNEYHDYDYPSQVHHNYNALQYEPQASYHSVYSFPSETKFTVSHSKVEFNDLEYEEYDPTPYSGGYDPVSTYGHPIPPSEKTCYPRSVPRLNEDTFASFSYGSFSLLKDLDGSKSNDPKPEPEGWTKNGDLLENNVIGVKPIDPDTDSENSDESGDDVKGEAVEQSGDNYPAYGSYDTTMHQYSYGSGLEAMDLCDTVFGYWPCLAKRLQQQQQQQMQQQQRDAFNEVWDRERRRDDPWESVADYLFGNPVVCDHESYGYR